MFAAVRWLAAPDSSQQKSTSFTPNVSTDGNPIEIQDNIHSVRFLADGEHVVTAGWEENIRRWQVVDGKEVGKPMDAGSLVFNVAVSQDGRWIVCGTQSGQVTVWNAKNYKKVVQLDAHEDDLHAVDVSADGRKFATGSDDRMVKVWSFPTEEQLPVPLKLEHETSVAAVKFSPGGEFIATASSSVRIYDVRDGQLLANFPIRVNSTRSHNESLAWARAVNCLFALSYDGDIHCLDVSTKETIAKWRIHSKEPTCIALACNDRVIVASANSSLSLWDTTTHQQIGNVIDHSHNISSMAISPNCVIATSGNKAITLWNLSNILPKPYREDVRLERELRRLQIEKSDFYDTVIMRASDARKKGDIANRLDKTVRELRAQLTASDEEKESLMKDTQSLRARDERSNHNVTNINELVQELQHEANALTETNKFLQAGLDAKEMSLGHLEQTVHDLRKQITTSQNALRAHDKKHECEVTRAHSRIYDVAQPLLEIANMMTKDLKPDKSIVHKVESLLTGVAKVALCYYSPNDVLGGADQHPKLMFHVYRAVCDALESDDRAPEAFRCFRKMQHDLSYETSTSDERSRWESDFRQRCTERLEGVGDAAVESQNHDAAIGSYSSVLSLNPGNINNIIVKCCKVRVDLLGDKLIAVTKVIECDPSNYKGYKQKHAILRSMGRHKEAFKAFEIMLSRMDNSPNPQVRYMRSQYLDVTSQIRIIVEQTIRDIPRVLIDTTTGRLCDKKRQASAFEELPIFDELRSSMTTPNRLDCARIKKEVEKFYQYVMFSHRWQPPEPSFHTVENVLIYGLPASPANNKLINFCKHVQSHRFRWAWSDTCCVNQSDKGVQQESVVSMFRWYCRAALTIIHLLGVHSKSQRKGSLRWSIWNMRGWTYQEYVASKVVQFYTEDWHPYLDLKIFNHKESSIILEEMEQATNFATQAFATLRPGLTKVQEKLYLASKRQTTREEDIAYSLFGIFNVALPVIYGEGNQAVGRLLEHILTRSASVTILAWTGISGSMHSYLPSDLTVYDKVVPSHVPQPVETAEMDRMVKDVQSCFPDPSLTAELYKQLYDLPSLSLVAGRLRLPGLVFPVDDLDYLSGSDSDTIHRVYRATVPALGDVRIETKDELVGLKGLVLIHPWISPLVDEDFSGSTPRLDSVACSLRFVVRLRQPFGALLLAPQEHMQYKRIATDSFIKVQIRSEMPLTELMQNVRTVDVQ